MKRVTLADFPGAPLIVVRDEALTPEEYVAYRKMRDWVNARERERRASDPEYRERCNAYMREWRHRNLEHSRRWRREDMRRRRAKGMAA